MLWPDHFFIVYKHRICGAKAPISCCKQYCKYILMILHFIIFLFFSSRREHWHLFSMYTCWQNLLNITKKQSHDHNVLSEICNNQMVTRLQDIVDNSQRIFKKVITNDPIKFTFIYSQVSALLLFPPTTLLNSWSLCISLYLCISL